MTGPLRVVIAGGGPGGLEAALALRSLMRDRIELTLVAAAHAFPYRPWSVAEPFGIGRTVHIDLGRFARDQGIGFVVDRVTAVDADAHELRTEQRTVPYDVLILALGAHQVPSVAGALTFRGPRDVARLREALEQLATGPDRRIAFVANPSAYWALPAYELALMARIWGARRDTPVSVAVVTGEREPLEAFGPVVAASMRELLEQRGVQLYTRTMPDSFDGERLLEAGAGSIRADLVVALPALMGPSLRGLPHDKAGFVAVDPLGRVAGHEDVFVVGDMAAHDLKQGGLATQQADVVAAQIAASTGVVCETPAYEPVLRAVLLTGESPLYLRHPAGPVDPKPADGSVGAPWWPPHKIAGRHLAPYLAVHADMLTPVTADV